MAYLDRVSDFAKGVESGEIKPKNKVKTDKIRKEIKNLFENGGVEVKKELPKPFAYLWDQIGISPEGVTRDLFKASQRLEGGVSDVEETLLWAFKSSLLGCMAHWLQGNLKKSVFGDSIPRKMEVNLGVLKGESPNLLLYGYFSPVLKHKIAEEAKKRGVHVTGVCSEPLIPPFSFPPVTNFGSQEIPLMTGAVDLIVAGNQFVNPSLSNLSRKWEVPIISAELLKREKESGRFAREIVERAKKSLDFRRNISRDIPDVKENAMMGFSPENVDVKKILGALNKGTLTGIVILTGSNNVKYTQDQEILTLAQEFLQNDVLCISEGEASVTLAKYGFLNPSTRDKNCGKALSIFLSSLGKQIPSVLDFAEGSLVDLLFKIAKTGKKELKDYPILACFPEANRSLEVVEAMGMVAMGISTYFWPALPVTGSMKAMETLTKFCYKNFGSKLNIITEKKIDPRAKANLMLKTLKGKEGFGMSGKPWK
jgi:carbon-monoxide dehydrogenase catalytic subunit